MPRPTGSDDDTSHEQEHEQRSEVMLTTPTTSSSQLRHPAYNNASTGAAILSENSTLVVHLKTDAYSYNSINKEINTVNDSSNSDHNHNNTITLSYEQLSREFYQSYDPSIGLHTAFVLGGILVWLVLYVVYRTKVRKYILRLIKKQFGEECDLEPKIYDSDSNCGASTNMVRTLINPSIVIDTSPPLSPLTFDQYSRPGEEECFSQYSLHGAGIHDEGAFSYRYPGQGGAQKYLNNFPAQACLIQHEILHQLPKSELDIPTATAQWVRKMPLEASRQQDFTSLMLSLQNYGLLAMHKPCSCPQIPSQSPQPLLMLEMPCSWNKSLPAVPNSLSNQVFSAYETAPMKHTTSDKDIKDIINAKRKISTHKNKNENHEQVLCDKNFTDKFSSSRRHGQTGTSYRNDRAERKPNLKMPPKLTVNTIDSKENQPLLDSSNFTRSPIPIPFTPTVMIQTANPSQRHRQDRDSTTSFSSNSSADMLLASIRAPPIHITKPGSPNRYSPRHTSPLLQNTNGDISQNVFSWSNEDIKRYHEEKCISDSAADTHPGCHSYQQCSFKYQRKLTPSEKECCLQRQHCSFDDSNSTNEAKHRGMFSPRRSMSDYNYHDDFLLNKPATPRGHYQRSISVDVPLLGNLQTEGDIPVCSKESNINSTRPFCFTPSPYLLQVPEPNNAHVTLTPDFVDSNKSLLGNSGPGPQPFSRHGVHSDSNIAYFTGQFFPSDPHDDNYSLRPHSAFIPGEINLSFCEDNTVRPSSSFGSSGSCNSPHHQPHLPHRHSSQHHHNLHHDQYHHHHHRHHSTGMLGLEDSNGQHNISCISHPHPFMNRSFSAVVMETKL